MKKRRGCCDSRYADRFLDHAGTTDLPLVAFGVVGSL